MPRPKTIAPARLSLAQLSSSLFNFLLILKNFYITQVIDFLTQLEKFKPNQMIFSEMQSKLSRALKTAKNQIDIGSGRFEDVWNDSKDLTKVK